MVFEAFAEESPVQSGFLGVNGLPHGSFDYNKDDLILKHIISKESFFSETSAVSMLLNFTNRCIDYCIYQFVITHAIEQYKPIHISCEVALCFN